MTLSRQALRSLESFHLDEVALFEFLSSLGALASNYRRDERFALAEDAEEYIQDAQEVAHHAFGPTWEAFLDRVQEHGGPILVAELQQLDPVEAATQGARQNLDAILNRETVATTASTLDLRETTADEIVAFCLDHDLLEVLSSLNRYSFTADDRRGDSFPGFLNRRLRALALAGEQLLRGIWEAAPSAQRPDGGPRHQGEKYWVLIAGLNEESSSWLPIFRRLVSASYTSDKRGRPRGPSREPGNVNTRC